MKKIFRTLSCVVVLFLALGIADLNAQIRVVNENGDVIILMPDGTWKYEDPEKEKKRTDKEKLPVLTAENTLPKPQKNEDPQKKETKKKEKPKKLTKKEAEAKKKAEKLAQEEAKKNEKALAYAKKNEKNKTKPQKTENKNTSTKEKKPKTITTAETSKNKPQKGKVLIYQVPERKRKTKTVVISEPVCEFATKEKDEFTNKIKVALVPRFFFSFTSEKLKPYMREKDYLTCTANLSRVIGITMLNVKFEVESLIAQREYGQIVEGTQLLVKLLNGRTITLVAQESDNGIVDEINGKTIYRTYFSIASGDEKVLRKSEVVRLRMLWSTGYEDYEVNELDFFIDQFKCLDTVKDL